MPDAIDRSDNLENALLTRMLGIYNDALKTVLRKQSVFFTKVKDVDSGKIRPPQHYVDNGQVDKWREMYLRRLATEYGTVDSFGEALDKAGEKAEEEIRKTIAEIWVENYQETTKTIEKESSLQGLAVSLMAYTVVQALMMAKKNETKFTKIAYRNIRTNPAVKRRIRQEFSSFFLNGESQEKLIRKIREITGMSYRQAKRVAQTERTRAQSYARWQAGQEASEMGVRIANMWSCRMIRSRDAHVERNGKWAMQGECFPGSVMKYPGDPDGGAEEVVNCYCVMIPHVLRENEYIDQNGNLRERAG